jgi:hypothetical protein
MRRTALRIHPALSSLGLLCLLGGLLLPSLSDAQTPRATLGSPSHDFGLVKQGERIAHGFQIRNEGTADLTLQVGELTLPGMTARLPSHIAPGAEGTIRLEWDTSRAKGPLEGAAVVRLNDPRQPEVQFVLKAEVQPPIEFQPFAAFFFSAFRGETPQQRVRLLNHEERPLKILGLETTSTRFTAAIQTVEPGKLYELTATVKADAAFGRSQETLSVLTDHPTRKRLTVLVNVLVKPDVYVNPEAVEFDPVQLADFSTGPGQRNLPMETFLVKTRQDEIALTSVSTDLDCLDIKQSPPEGTSGIFRIDVRLQPARLRTGPIAGSIRIRTSDPRFPELSVPVRGEVR